MICPHCQSEFDVPVAECPDCGVKILRQVSGVLKTSTVMIGTGRENSVYRSVEDVPEPLRRKLIETTSGENSGMIVIADTAGRAQWTEIVALREAREKQDAPEKQETSEDDPARQPRAFAGLSWVAWAGVLLFLAASALIGSVLQVFRSR